MIETGITIDGVPLEDHLEDKKRKRFFKSMENEIQKEKNLIYNSKKTKCRQRHNTRPSKVRHISKEEYYMEPKSAGEMILLMLNNDQWWPIKKMATANKTYGKRAYAQAMSRLIERFPALIKKQKVNGLTNEYALQPYNSFLEIDLIKLYRKEFTFEQFVLRYPKMGLGVREPEILTSKTLLEHVKDLQILVIDLQNRVSKLEQPELIERLEVAKDSGVNINVYLVDPRQSD